MNSDSEIFLPLLLTLHIYLVSWNAYSTPNRIENAEKIVL